MLGYQWLRKSLGGRCVRQGGLLFPAIPQLAHFYPESHPQATLAERGARSNSAKGFIGAAPPPSARSIIGPAKLNDVDPQGLARRRARETRACDWPSARKTVAADEGPLSGAHRKTFTHFEVFGF